MKNVAVSTLLLLASVSICLLLAEGAAQIYAYKIEKRGKLFEPDSALGWRVVPNLSLERLNADGEIWHVVTDANGIRGGSRWDGRTGKKVLILGDSFAFGEGVSLEKRFDTLLQEDQAPEYSFLNLGVMGYATDQQLIGAKAYFETMKQGDAVILLTYFNDFFDILKTRHAGRSKPWYELVDPGMLVEHKPRISWIEHLRDKSYLFAMTMSVVEKYRSNPSDDIRAAGGLYHAMVVEETRELAERGVRVLVAYHGIPHAYGEAQSVITSALDRTCSTFGIECVSLDSALMIANGGDNFLRDGHWNGRGHRVVAGILGQHLADWAVLSAAGLAPGTYGTTPAWALEDR